MKSLQFLLILFVSTLTLNSLKAQIPGGTLRYGGDLSFNNTSYKEVSYTRLEIQLSPGYFLVQNLLTSLDIRYAWLRDRFQNYIHSDHSIGFGPSFSYYISSSIPQLYFPITIYGGYEYTERANVITNGPFRGELIYYGGNIAVEFIPSEALGLRFSFGPHSWYFLDSDITGNGSVVNWQARIGVSYYFFKGKE